MRETDPEPGRVRAEWRLRGPRLTATSLVRLLVLAFVVHTFVVPQLGGARAALSTVSGVSPLLLVVAAMLETAAITAYGALSQMLLPAEAELGLGYCTAVAVASIGINHVVPGGAAATAAVNYRLFGRVGIPRPALALTLATQAIGSALVLNVLLWIALLISIPVSGFHPIYGTVAAFGAALMVLFAGVLLGLRRHRDGFGRVLARTSSLLSRTDGASIERSVHEMAAHVDVLFDDVRLIRMGFAAATLNWLLDAAALWMTLTAFGHRPGVVGLMVAFGLANVLGALPVTPGGLGVIEAVLIPTLVAFGTPASVAAVGVVAYRLVNFWLPIPVGLAAYAVLRRRPAPGSADDESLGHLLTDLLDARAE